MKSSALFLVCLTFAACGTAPQTKTEPPLTRQAPSSDEIESPCTLPVMGEWTMFQADAARSGAISAPVIRKPSVKWKTQVGIQGWLNNPVIAGGLVFVGSNGQVWNKPDASDGVWAIDMKDGKVAWFTPFDDDVNGVAYVACRVIATSDDGSVRALNAATGKVVWSHRASDAKVYTNPLVLGQMVVVGNAEGIVSALRVETGEVRWTYDAGSAIRGGLSADGAHVYVATEEGVISAINQANGMLVWEERGLSPWQMYGAPTLVSGQIVQGYARDTTYETPALASYDTSTGRLIWNAGNPLGLKAGWGNIRSSPAVWRGVLVWGEPYSNRVVGGQLQRGEVLWSSSAGACFFPHFSSPAIASGTAYIGRTDGGLYAFDVASGEESWRIYLGQQTLAGQNFPEQLTEAYWDRCLWGPDVGHSIYASPAIASDGTIVVGSLEGWLYAVGEQ